MLLPPLAALMQPAGVDVRGVALHCNVTSGGRYLSTKT